MTVLMHLLIAALLVAGCASRTTHDNDAAPSGVVDVSGCYAVCQNTNMSDDEVLGEDTFACIGDPCTGGHVAAGNDHARCLCQTNGEIMSLNCTNGVFALFTNGRGNTPFAPDEIVNVEVNGEPAQTFFRCVP